MNIALATTLSNTDVESAVQRVTDALARHGFGILTRIDMHATLKAKLDVDMEPYVILGACNPALAHRAVGVLPQIGLLLPCNVVVRADATSSNVVIVEAMNPEMMVAATGEDGLTPVASEAGALLRAALEDLN